MTEIAAAMQTYENEFALQLPSLERVPAIRKEAARALLDLATGAELAHGMLHGMAESGLLDVRARAPSFAVALGKKGALPSAQVVEFLDSQIPELERGKVPVGISGGAHVVAHRAATASMAHAKHVGTERVASADYSAEIPSLDAYRAAKLGERAMAFLDAENPDAAAPPATNSQFARPRLVISQDAPQEPIAHTAGRWLKVAE